VFAIFVGLGWPLWLLLGVCVLALAGPSIAPRDPFLFDVVHRLEKPALAHPFGTDQYGRDVLSRMLVGARSLVVISGLATLVTLAIGVTWGLMAAYFRGFRDEVLMRMVDIAISIPELLIAIMILTVFGPGTWNLVIAVAVVFAPFVSRIVRSAALVVVAEQYVDAARTAGERAPRIIFREVLPNIMPLLLVEAAVRFSFVVLVVASLGFLGLGVQPPTPDWGLMVSESRDFASSAPWLIAFPAAGIALMVISCHTLADRLAGSDEVIGAAEAHEIAQAAQVR
jgi:peptide/nickel transport system permease protein